MSEQDIRTRTDVGAVPQDPRSIRDVVGDIIEDVRLLVRGELALARAEIDEKIDRLMVAGASIVGGIVLAFAALNLLLAALVAAIDESGLGIPTWLAAVIVAGVVAIIGYILVRSGQKALQLKRLMPERTAANVQADARVVRNQLS
jgi:hypothetical protein